MTLHSMIVVYDHMHFLFHTHTLTHTHTHSQLYLCTCSCALLTSTHVHTHCTHTYTHRAEGILNRAHVDAFSLEESQKLSIFFATNNSITGILKKTLDDVSCF